MSQSLQLDVVCSLAAIDVNGRELMENETIFQSLESKHEDSKIVHELNFKDAVKGEWQSQQKQMIYLFRRSEMASSNGFAE
jgi:hypothetical protein